MILCFELSMPRVNSWNGRWSGQDDVHVKMITRRSKNEVEEIKKLDGQSWWHHWEDGWSACVTARIVDAKEAAKLRKKNRGFCGYDWMVESILRFGEIRYKEDWEQ